MKGLLSHGKQETYEAYQPATPIQEEHRHLNRKSSWSVKLTKNLSNMELKFGIVILSPPCEFSVHLNGSTVLYTVH